VTSVAIVACGVLGATGAMLAGKHSSSRVWEAAFFASAAVFGAGMGAMWSDGWRVSASFLFGATCGALPFALGLFPRRVLTSIEAHQFVQDLDDASYERLCWAMVDRSRSK
jgi:hypothetical protein